MNGPGCVYLVGAGPGDKGLLTVRGACLLESCDCIIYDHLVGEEVLEYGRADCERIFVGKEKGCHHKSQDEINALLIQKAGEHRVIVRLKGGDPFVFGRGGEEAMALEKAGIPYEVVPGVTAAVAVPEAAGIPVTFRQISRSFQVITGSTKEDAGLPQEFYHLRDYRGTVVFLMGAGQLETICSGLIGQGWDLHTPAAIIQNGTLPEQRSVSGTLSDLPEKAGKAGIGAPAVIVAGETAGLELLSKKRRPLEGLQVGIAGTDHFTGRLRVLLESRGARVKVVCRLQVLPLEDPAIEESYAHIERYTWLVFTSANGVRLYLEGLLGGAGGRDLRCLGRIKIAAMGKGTEGALKGYRLKADYVPKEANSHALAVGLAERLGQEDRVLLPRARQGSKELPRLLEQKGIFCQDLALYDVKGAGSGKETARERGRSFKDADLDYLVFASASGVNAYFSEVFFAGEGQQNDKEKEVTICCIGEATADALRRYGIRAGCIATEASAEGIVKKLLERQKSRIKDL